MSDVLERLDNWGPMTVLIILVVAIVLLVGGAVCVINPDALSFEGYLDAIQKVTYAVAGTALARAGLKGAKTLGDAKVQAAVLAPAPPHIDLPGAAVEDPDVDALDDEDLPSDVEEFGPEGPPVQPSQGVGGA